MWAKIRTDLFLRIFTIIPLAEIPTTGEISKINIWVLDRETSICRWVVVVGG